jgi:outer membrane usher protein
MVLVVGSDTPVSVYGTLVDEAGKPVGLAVATITPLDGQEVEPVQMFTNRAGRFAASDLAAGRYEARFATEPPLVLSFEIPEGTIGLYDLGKVIARPQ